MSSIAHVEPRSNSTKKALVGWVAESPGRGTESLLVTCAFTIFLCTWVVIHARVHETKSLRTLHKLILFLKGIVAPELIAVEALQEWSQAKKMVKSCEEVSGGGFKLVHAFYIGMLAVRYRTPQGERVVWPNQYAWLLHQGLVEWKDHANWGLDEKNIRDKSNADSSVKLLALWQVSWFVAQSIMRVAHHLPLSALESMTLSYIPLFAVTYSLWWLKPKDIDTASIVNLPPMSPEKIAIFESIAVSNVFDCESEEKQGSLRIIWQLTPRVFEKEAEDRVAHTFMTNVSPGITEQEIEQGMHRKDGRDEQDIIYNNRKTKDRAFNLIRPKENVVARWDPDLYHSRLWPIICLFAISFPALHLLAWDTEFPTVVERWLWRASASVSISSMLVFMHFEKVVLKWGGPMTMISIMSPGLYFVSRIVIIVGGFAALRASDPGIYNTYLVSNYWIHVL